MKDLKLKKVMLFITQDRGNLHPRIWICNLLRPQNSSLIVLLMRRKTKLTKVWNFSPQKS